MENQIKQTKSAGGVVVNQYGQVLVVSQHGTSWSLPKGHIDEGEDPVNAARREIYEESGITNLKLVEELRSYKRYKINEEGGDDQSELKTIVMYLFRIAESLLKPVDLENPEARWVDMEEVAKLLTHAKDREFFLEIKKEI